MARLACGSMISGSPCAVPENTLTHFFGSICSHWGNSTLATREAETHREPANGTTGERSSCCQSVCVGLALKLLCQLTSVLDNRDPGSFQNLIAISTFGPKGLAPGTSLWLYLGGSAESHENPWCVFHQHLEGEQECHVLWLVDTASVIDQSFGLQTDVAWSSKACDRSRSACSTGVGVFQHNTWYRWTVQGLGDSMFTIGFSGECDDHFTNCQLRRLGS